MALNDVMMIQMGARRHYAYTRQLEQAGLLHSFITDAAWASKANWTPWLANRLFPKLKPALARRIVPMRNPKRLESSILPNVFGTLAPSIAVEKRYTITDNVLGRIAERRWDERVQVVVNYFGNGGTFLERAKTRGALIVTDFISHPFHWDTVQEERDRWPGWEDDTNLQASRDAYVERVRRLILLSDIYCCPALSIADALSHFDGFDETKVRLLPYGAPPQEPIHLTPFPGRILCAASAFSLFKGLPYLAQAATIVRDKHPYSEFIVAGDIPSALRNRAELRPLTFLGQIGKDKMAAQYAQAEMFCLPTLSEGSATVIFEAMNHGIPCIATRACGSVIKHGHDGIIVPERNAEAIANAICHLIEDSAFRNKISAASRKTAQRFSDKICGESFVEMVARLPRRSYKSRQ